MIFPWSYSSILYSVVLIFLGKLVKCDKTKYSYADRLLSDSGSYLSRISVNNNSSTPTSSVLLQTEGKEQSQTNKTQVNPSSKPGTSQYHWYFYDYDHDQNLEHENENLNQVDIQPEIQEIYGTPPSTYGIDYHYPPYGYINNEVFHTPLAKYPNFFYQKLFLKKLFSILGPVLFPLPFFLALMPLAIPAIPLALFVGRIHGDSPNMPPVSPTLPTLPTTIPILTTEEEDPNSSSSFMSSSSSSSSNFTQTSPTQPSPGTTNPQPPESMSSNSNTSFSSSSSSSGMMTSEMPQPTMMSTMSSEGGTGSTISPTMPSRPPGSGIGFPTFPTFLPPFPFLFLNNTFDDMHYYRKNKLIFKSL